MLDCIIIEPSRNAEAAVVWLHGLGADASDFASLPTVLPLPANHGIRFIFPNAPLRPITLNGGQLRRAWFDLPSLNDAAFEQSDGLLQSAVDVDQLIQNQLTQGIARKAIILAGFSQGGTVALYYGMHHPGLAGIIGLSTYLSKKEILTAAAAAAPIFLAHGANDNIIPFAMGKTTQQTLLTQHYSVAWYEYAMEHTVCAKEFEDIGQFIRNVLEA